MPILLEFSFTISNEGLLMQDTIRSWRMQSNKKASEKHEYCFLLVKCKLFLNFAQLGYTLNYSIAL